MQKTLIKSYFCISNFQTLKENNLEEITEGKVLYDYQKDALEEIFKRFETAPPDYHLLYQLPTGGGKTEAFLGCVVFSLFFETPL